MSAGEIVGIINKTFQKTVANADVPEELKRAALDSDRRHRFLYNLTKEVTKGKKYFMKETIKVATRDLTLLYLKNLMRVADETRLSVNERRRRLDEAELMKEVDAQASDWADQMRVEEYGGRKTDKI